MRTGWRAVFEKIGNAYQAAGAGLDLAEIHCLQGAPDQAQALAEQSHRGLRARAPAALARAQELRGFVALLRDGRYEQARPFTAFFDTVLEIGALAEYAERLIQRAEHLLAQRWYAAVQEMAAHHMLRCQGDDDAELVQHLRAELDSRRRQADAAAGHARKPAALDARIADLLSAEDGA